MVGSPEAEPVSAARTFVATASETRGPPSMDRTKSRTMAKAGSAATTAPKPKRLATLIAGSTEALAPASNVSRSDPCRKVPWARSDVVEKAVEIEGRALAEIVAMRIDEALRRAAP